MRGLLGSLSPSIFCSLPHVLLYLRATFILPTCYDDTTVTVFAGLGPREFGGPAGSFLALCPALADACQFVRVLLSKLAPPDGLRPLFALVYGV